MSTLEATAGRSVGWSKSTCTCGSINCFAYDSLSKILSNHRKSIPWTLHLLKELILVSGILLQASLHFQNRSIFRSTLRTFFFIIPKATLMEWVHTHKMYSREIKCESACSALAKLKYSGICPEILNFFSHCQSVFLQIKEAHLVIWPFSLNENIINKILHISGLKIIIEG